MTSRLSASSSPKRSFMLCSWSVFTIGNCSLTFFITRRKDLPKHFFYFLFTLFWYKTLRLGNSLFKKIKTWPYSSVIPIRTWLSEHFSAELVHFKCKNLIQSWNIESPEYFKFLQIFRIFNVLSAKKSDVTTENLVGKINQIRKKIRSIRKKHLITDEKCENYWL